MGVLALGVVVVDRVVGDDRAEPGDPPTSAAEPCDTASGPCPGDGEAGPDGSDPPSVLPAAEVCPSAGYLCAGLEEGSEIRAIRWNELVKPFL